MNNLPRTFEQHAPNYFAAGLQVIPLWPKSKAPIPDKWSEWSEKPIDKAQFDEWVLSNPYSNIGVVAGAVSGIVGLDIDTDDPAVYNALRKLLPPSPWERKGAKGSILVFRYSGEKTFRLKTADTKKNIVELLSSGTQFVLPPSIHPDTGLPYVANADLFDPVVLASLTALPPDFELLLRAALEEAGVKLSVGGSTRVTEFIASGARDVQMVAVAGHYANGVLRGELSFKEGIARMVAWHATCTEKVAGDEIDIEKGIRRLAEFLIRDVIGPKKRGLPKGWDDQLTDAEKAAFGFAAAFTEDNEIWDYAKAFDFFRAGLLTTDPDTVERMTLLDTTLAHIAKGGMSEIEEEKLLRYMLQAGDYGVVIGTLKRRLAELKGQGVAGLDHAEIAQAVIEEMGQTGELRHDLGSLWQWGGSHWNAIDEQTVLRKISEGYGHLPAAKRNSDHVGILKTVKTLVTKPIRTNHEHFVNFANGVLGTDLFLRDHDPEYGMTYTLPFRYLEEQGNQLPPKFAQFLDDAWGTTADYAEKLIALRQAIASTMYGVAYRFERAVLLFGPPACGKSQMLRIVQDLLPEETISAVSPDQWKDTFLPAQMVGKLLNVAGELSETRKIDGQSFKAIVSGEQISVQHKYSTPFRTSIFAAHWFASNHLPATRDTSSAFNRRWLILSFDKPVKLRDKKVNLGMVIAQEEREMIASWAVHGITSLFDRQDYVLPQSHGHQIEEMARINNTVRRFMTESGRITVCELLEGSQTTTWITEEQAYSTYCAYTLAQGDARPVGLIGFRKICRELATEFGYRVKSIITESGASALVFEGLTLAKPNVVKLRSSS